jgi:hypothetical protein
MSWEFGSLDSSIIEYMDPDGAFLVCTCCKKYGSELSKTKLRVNPGLVASRRPFGLCRWKDHIQSARHKGCMSCMDEGRKKTQSIIGFTKPLIKHSALALMKKGGHVTQSSSGKMTESTKTPFWRKHCNGMVPTVELINMHYRNANMERNASLQKGLQCMMRYFKCFEDYYIAMVPGSKLYSIFGMHCEKNINLR